MSRNEPTEDRELDSVESLLSELKLAERAGVFGQTRLNAAEALRHPLTPSHAPLRFPRNRAVLAVAAVVALAFTVWTWMFVAQINDVRARRGVGAGLGQELVGQPSGRFSVDCITGPRDDVDDPCLENDLDTDGRVTLADFQQFQLKPGLGTH